MNQGNEAIPVGTWVHLDMEVPALSIIGFTYVDHEAGLSAKGSVPDDPGLGESLGYTIRLFGPNPGLTWEALSEEQIDRLHLPRTPEWLKFYGEQPRRTTRWGEWRRHPALVRRFRSEHPDDLQVLVHDGGPKLTRARPEVVWVRMTGMEGDVFRGLVLNQPSQLMTIRQWGEVTFIVAEGLEFPLRVTEKYLRERDQWTIHPCNKCGLSELLDAPSDLIQVTFPDLPEKGISMSFTQFCPLCGGVLCLESTDQPFEENESVPARQAGRRHWWQFWT